jgi:V-type H+-transporting ATPase subunit d
MLLLLRLFTLSLRLHVCLFLQELLDKCHPLGMFDSIATLAVAQNMRELFRLVLVDTPLAPYFSENLTHEDLDEMNIEVRGCLGL